MGRASYFERVATVLLQKFGTLQFLTWQSGTAELAEVRVP